MTVSTKGRARDSPSSSSWRWTGSANVPRQSPLAAADRRANDAEHSWHLALRPRPSPSTPTSRSISDTRSTSSCHCPSAPARGRRPARGAQWAGRGSAARAAPAMSVRGSSLALRLRPELRCPRSTVSIGAAGFPGSATAATSPLRRQAAVPPSRGVCSASRAARARSATVSSCSQLGGPLGQQASAVGRVRPRVRGRRRHRAHVGGQPGAGVRAVTARFDSLVDAASRQPPREAGESPGRCHVLPVANAFPNP